MIQNVTHLLRARRFAPLFATQFLGAFNDSLFKQAVVLFVTYQLYSNPAKEFQFSAIAQGLFILPFFLFSALSGQLADDHDKARLIRIIMPQSESARPELGAATLVLAASDKIDDVIANLEKAMTKLFTRMPLLSN